MLIPEKGKRGVICMGLFYQSRDKRGFPADNQLIKSEEVAGWGGRSRRNIKS